MKYIPLVWAALWRKPVRLILTLLSVVIAFSLFGMMIGFKASFSHYADTARGDRIYVNSRFFQGLPGALRDQIARVPGVIHVTTAGVVGGYYQTPKNVAFAMMIDPDWRQVVPEFPVTPQQYGELAANPTDAIITQTVARRFKLKKGDVFPLKAPGVLRADGGQTWAFTILAVVNDIESEPQGFMLGNLKYFNEARIASKRDTGLSYRVIVNDASRGDAIAKLIDQTFANSGTPTRSISEKTAAEQGTSGGGGIDFPFVMVTIAGAGLFMILFLTGNAIAQSVRERVPEFAVLKTIGFSDRGVMALVFAEAAIPCLLGAAIGMALAAWIATIFSRLLPPNVGFPPPYMSAWVFGLAFLFAVAVAAVSAVWPAARMGRLDVATALSRR